MPDVAELVDDRPGRASRGRSRSPRRRRPRPWCGCSRGCASKPVGSRAEHHHRVGASRRAGRACRATPALKASSSVIRWSDGAISAGALPYLCGERRDAQRERGRRPGRVLLEDQVLRRHRAERRAGGVGEARTGRDVDAAGVDDLAEPLDRAGEQRAVAHDGLELLGRAVPADRPQARALAAGEDDGDRLVRGVSHGSIPSCAARSGLGQRRSNGRSMKASASSDPATSPDHSRIARGRAEAGRSLGVRAAPGRRPGPRARSSPPCPGVPA